MRTEARRHQRKILFTRCWCDGENVTLYVRILNASAGGLFVKTRTPFRPGTKVVVRWAFPGEKDEHLAMAEVVWKRDERDPNGMGVKFIDPPWRTVEALERLDEPAP